MIDDEASSVCWGDREKTMQVLTGFSDNNELQRRWKSWLVFFVSFCLSGLPCPG